MSVLIASGKVKPKKIDAKVYIKEKNPDILISNIDYMRFKWYHAFIMQV
jgi:hypothetical protein